MTAVDARQSATARYANAFTWTTSRRDAQAVASGRTASPTRRRPPVFRGPSSDGWCYLTLTVTVGLKVE
ncbi:hypothetical protein, partial [Mycolicibacterium arseniciresistens]